MHIANLSGTPDWLCGQFRHHVLERGCARENAWRHRHLLPAIYQRAELHRVMRR